MRQAWFAQLIQSALVATATDAYSDFGTTGAAALDMMAVRRDIILSSAGLADYFEQILSADMVRRLKPAPQPYLMAAERMGVPIGAFRMIAAHAWDIAAALRAGCTAAFVARPGMVLDPLVRPPNIIGANMREVADQILAVELATM